MSRNSLGSRRSGDVVWFVRELESLSIDNLNVELCTHIASIRFEVARVTGFFPLFVTSFVFLVAGTERMSVLLLMRNAMLTANSHG